MVLVISWWISLGGLMWYSLSGCTFLGVSGLCRVVGGVGCRFGFA